MAVSRSGKSRKLLGEMILAAGRAQHLRAVAYQLFELRSAVLTQVFKDRHSKIYSTRANAILSTQASTSLAGAVKLLTMIENASQPRVLLSA
jgi:hypothetical protein